MWHNEVFVTDATIMEKEGNYRMLLIFHDLMKHNTILHLVKADCIALKKAKFFGVINPVVNKVMQIMMLLRKCFLN